MFVNNLSFESESCLYHDTCCLFAAFYSDSSRSIVEMYLSCFSIEMILPQLTISK